MPENTRTDSENTLTETVIGIDRVARVVKGGRRFRFKALVVVGDGKNQLGVGVSKGADVQAAIGKASDEAKKNMITVALRGDTIPHEAEAKVGGSKILLKPASPGTGLIAGGTVRAVLNVIGLSNVLSKSLGSSNKVNTAYATVEALKQLVSREEWPNYNSRETVVKKPVKKATARGKK
jgi:small subunit ribosomal protein S5